MTSSQDMMRVYGPQDQQVSRYGELCWHVLARHENPKPETETRPSIAADAANTNTAGLINMQSYVTNENLRALSSVNSFPSQSGVLYIYRELTNLL